MEKNIKEAISIIEDVRKSMPECANKAFLKGALNELNEALHQAPASGSVLLTKSDMIEFAEWMMKRMRMGKYAPKPYMNNNQLYDVWVSETGRQ